MKRDNVRFTLAEDQRGNSRKQNWSSIDLLCSYRREQVGVVATRYSNGKDASKALFVRYNPLEKMRKVPEVAPRTPTCSAESTNSIFFPSMFTGLTILLYLT